jgi:hypothetical protein
MNRDLVGSIYEKLEGQWAELVSLTFHSVFSKLYTEPSKDASYQVSVHLAKPFQRRKQELPVVAMFVNGSGLNEYIYRGPFIDASY